MRQLITETASAHGPISRHRALAVPHRREELLDPIRSSSISASVPSSRRTRPILKTTGAFPKRSAPPPPLRHPPPPASQFADFLSAPPSRSPWSRSDGARAALGLPSSRSGCPSFGTGTGRPCASRHRHRALCPLGVHLGHRLIVEDEPLRPSSPTPRNARLGSPALMRDDGKELIAARAVVAALGARGAWRARRPLLRALRRSGSVSTSPRRCYSPPRRGAGAAADTPAAASRSSSRARAR